MRNSKTHSVTMKKKLIKCQSVFNAYNEIQLSQDYDLSAYKGFQVTKWVYRIVNYPGYADKDCIQITLLVYNGYVIGGDVCSVELDGFMHGFKK